MIKKIKEHALSIAVSFLIALVFIAYLYKIVLLVSSFTIISYIFTTAFSIVILNLILIFLIYEKRKFALKFCMYLYFYIAIIEISLFAMGRMDLPWLVLNLAICGAIILYCATHKKAKELFSR